MSASKETLRTEAKRHRVLIDPRSEDADLACANLFEALKPGRDLTIGAYWPKDREFDPRPILDRFLKEGNPCALPVVQKDSLILKFAKWDDSMDLAQGPFDVLQPVINESTQWLDPDIVIVPMLAFDRRGYRLGHGGGYYDATLADLRARKAIIAVGVAYAQQACLFNLPVEDHDQKLDWIITPQGAMSYT